MSHSQITFCYLRNPDWLLIKASMLSNPHTYWISLLIILTSAFGRNRCWMVKSMNIYYMHISLQNWRKLTGVLSNKALREGTCYAHSLYLKSRTLQRAVHNTSVKLTAWFFAFENIVECFSPDKTWQQKTGILDRIRNNYNAVCFTFPAKEEGDSGDRGGQGDVPHMGRIHVMTKDLLDICDDEQ